MQISRCTFPFNFGARFSFFVSQGFSMVESHFLLPPVFPQANGIFLFIFMGLPWAKGMCIFK